MEGTLLSDSEPTLFPTEAGCEEDSHTTSICGGVGSHSLNQLHDIEIYILDAA